VRIMSDGATGMCNALSLLISPSLCLSSDNRSFFPPFSSSSFSSLWINPFFFGSQRGSRDSSVEQEQGRARQLANGAVRSLRTRVLVDPGGHFGGHQAATIVSRYFLEQFLTTCAVGEAE